MNELLRITVFLIGFLFALSNIYLLIKRKVSERTGILWMFTFLISFVVSAFPLTLNRFAHFVGVSYPPSLLFLVAILMLLTLTMYQSIQISSLDQKLREIGQTVAILEQSIRGLRQQRTNISGDGHRTEGMEEA